MPEEIDSFTHEGKKYNLDKAKKIVANRPVVYMKVSDLKWILKFTTTESERIKTADIENPIIVIMDKNKIVAVDGAHRIKKSVQDKIKILPGKFITEEELQTCSLIEENYLTRIKTLAGIWQQQDMLQ